MNECDRCGIEARDVRLTWVNLEREARADGRPYVPPPFGLEHRCPDKEACRERAKRVTEAEA